MTVRETARGPCVVCGEESEGSVYWVYPYPVAMMFVPGINLSLCGADCSAVYEGER